MPESKCSKCQRYCRLVATFLFSHIGLCALVVGYSIIGAFTFEALEAGHEISRRQLMLKERENVVSGLWSLTSKSSVLSEHNWTAMAIETLQDFEVTLVRAVRKEGYDGKDESPLQWTFSGALLYSIIVITTIGYGNIAPKTPWGKVITILYAIVGIPLLLLCLSNIGDAMAHSFKFIYWKVCCYLCVRPKKRRKRATNRPLPVPYRQPIVHQHSNSTHIQPPPICTTEVICTSPVPESPPLHSSSTYHTAQSCPSPTISSPGSTPRHQNEFETSKSAIVLNSQTGPLSVTGYYAQDIPLAPVITNKYALQEDVPIDGHQLQLQNKKSAAYPSPLPAIYTVMNPRECDKFQYGNHQSYRTNGRYQWKGDAYQHQDEDVEMAGDGGGSFRDLSPDLDEDEEEVSVPMWLCVALVVGYICGGAVLFTFWEKWDFLDSSYFCFVTLTTIGFGDLVPGTAVISDDNQLTLGLCSLYLLFGMALLAMSFNLVQEEVTRSMRCIGRRIGIISSDDEDD